MEQNKYNILVHTCRISDHPVKSFPQSIRLRYIKGLARVLYYLSDGNETMRTLFCQWAYSITDKDMSSLFAQKSDDPVKDALSLNRVGFHFFRCKHEFFFDCFYLIETYDKALLPKLQNYLNLVGKNYFTKEALSNTILFFNGARIPLKASRSQISHRDDNVSFKNRRCFRVLVVANVSAGKSTLINALLGYDFNKVKTTACTSRLCEIYNKPDKDGFAYYKASILQYEANVDLHSSDEATQCSFHFESTLGNSSICLIDTPGVNNSTDQRHWKITTDAILTGNYDMILFISNGQYNGTVDERKIIDFIHKHCNKPVLFALNQLDRFKTPDDCISTMINDYTAEIRSVGFRQPKVIPVSALYALLTRRDEKLEEDELEELSLLKKRFSKDYYNLPHYVGLMSNSEIEKTGIISLEQEITNLINI